ncbi:hypothetical protein V1477_015159 [Vespula maculifrons]
MKRRKKEEGWVGKDSNSDTDGGSDGDGDVDGNAYDSGSGIGSSGVSNSREFSSIERFSTTTTRREDYVGKSTFPERQTIWY